MKRGRTTCGGEQKTRGSKNASTVWLTLSRKIPSAGSAGAVKARMGRLLVMPYYGRASAGLQGINGQGLYRRLPLPLWKVKISAARFLICVGYCLSCTRVVGRVWFSGQADNARTRVLSRLL